MRHAVVILFFLCGLPTNAAEPNRTAPDRAPVIAGLIAALGDSDPEVRQNLAVALSRLAPASLAPLQQALQDRVAERRAGAALALALIGPAAESAIPTLLLTLKDEDLNVRRQVSFALAAILANPETSSSLLGRRHRDWNLGQP